jgi:lipopolysaccharide biosynthesis regulator YciM
MAELLVGALLFVAVIIGWVLGKFESRRQQVIEPRHPLTREYFHGLNLLLNERQDEAMDVFLKTLEVNPDTLETYLIMSSVYRRRGEVDRAIRIHQELMARPSLDKTQLAMVRFELARDYLKAGVLDRSERILRELVQEGAPNAVTCLEYLLAIFEQEREWRPAIDTANSLIAKGKSTLARSLAHYHCELANDAMLIDDWVEARQQLKQALQADKNCVRASLMLGVLECQVGNWRDAVKVLRKVKQQDPRFLPEVLEPLKKSYEALNQRDELLKYLFECLESNPGISVVLMLSALVKELKNDADGAYVLSEYLKKRPSVKGLDRLINFQIDNASGHEKESLLILQAFTQQMIKNKPVYRCDSCGFEGKQLHWHCPGCKKWGTVTPIQGLEGE